MPVVAILSLRKTRMRVIFDYVVESGHLFLVVLQFRELLFYLNTIMPPSHTLKDTTNQTIAWWYIQLHPTNWQ